jgi:hypothetical protein
MATKTAPDILRVAVKIPKGLLERVEDFQFARRLDSRVAALRQLIEIGLKANSPGSGLRSSPAHGGRRVSHQGRVHPESQPRLMCIALVEALQDNSKRSPNSGDS